MSKKAFTLVELIVVMTILGILSTIVFISFQGYTKKSRDTVRKSDIGNIMKSLDLYYSNTSNYPIPDNPEVVYYKNPSNEVWTQGTVGMKTINKLVKLNKVPLDPLTGKEYTYSILNTRREYQVAAALEGGAVSLIDNKKIDILPQANAANGDLIGIAYVKGNYNGKITKVQSGSTTYVLALPSIINGEMTLTDIIEVLNNNKLVYDGYGNLPSSYSGTVFKIDGGFNYSKTGGIVVYSGSINDLRTDEESRLIMFKNIQDYYKNTIIKNKDNIKNIVDLDISLMNPSEGLKFLAKKTLEDSLNESVKEDYGLSDIGPKNIDSPVCGLNTPGAYSWSDTNWRIGSFCDVGTANPISPTFPSQGNSTSWICENNGESATCSATRGSPISPTCGGEDGEIYSYDVTDWSTSNFCGVGTSNPSSPTFPSQGTSTTWICENDGLSESCSATRGSPISPTCGGEDGEFYSYDVTDWSTSNFCGVGTPNPSSPTFPSQGSSTYWDCENDGLSESCNATRGSPISPTCGGEDGEIYSYNVTDWSTSNFCDVGTPNPSSPTFPGQGNSTSWDCENDGVSITCNASRGVATSPTCGGEDGEIYSYDVTDWSTSNFCGVGTPNPSSPTFPSQGSSTSWICENDSESITCSASKSLPLTDWRNVDPNCEIANITIGSQTWAGCNSTLGDGVEWGKRSNGSDGDIVSCYNYNLDYSISGCGLGDLNMSSDDSAKDFFDLKQPDGKNEHNDVEFDTIWGKLYKKNNLNSACPTGWHVPTKNEFDTLIDYITVQNSGSNEIGWRLHSSKSDINNMANALKIPLTGWGKDEKFYGRGYYAVLWYEISGNYNARGFTSNNYYVLGPYSGHNHLFSVRCIKD